MYNISLIRNIGLTAYILILFEYINSFFSSDTSLDNMRYNILFNDKISRRYNMIIKFNFRKEYKH